MTTPAHRERRWLLLAPDGSHAWLGRASDPTEGEIQAAEQALQRAGTGGYLAVSEGDYWLEGPMTLLQVRKLGNPSASFGEAVHAFDDKRRQAMGEAL